MAGHARVVVFSNFGTPLDGGRVNELKTLKGSQQEVEMSYCVVLASMLFLFACGAVPVSQAQTGGVTRFFQLNGGGSFLGIQMEDVTSANMSRYKLNAERGVIVTSVMKGSPAEAASLHEGDVILEFGGFEVWSAAQLSRLAEETPPGRKAELVVSRDGKRINLTAQLGDNERRFYDRNAFPRDFPGPDFFFRQFGAPNQPNTAQKPRLGVTLQPLTEQLADYFGVPGKKGALISSVANDSPSAGKLKPGDVVIAADGKEIASPEDLSSFIRNKGEGNITMKVIRDKKEITVVINLPSADQGGGSYKL
jgi:C-terminal processing protease CtpA/Prc